MTFPGELENDVDGSFLCDFKLLELVWGRSAIVVRSIQVAYRSYDCNIEMEEIIWRESCSSKLL